MSAQYLDFDARIVKARKQHQCLACERPVAKGEVHIVYPGKNSEGKFMSTRLCIECSFLITQKTGANASNIRRMVRMQQTTGRRSGGVTKTIFVRSRN